MLYIPNVYGVEATEDCTLELVSTVDLQTYTAAITKVGEHHLYYQFGIMPPEDAANGEYRYSLMQDGVELSGGLLYLVNEREDMVQYENSIEYEQYKN